MVCGCFGGAFGVCAFVDLVFCCRCCFCLLGGAGSVFVFVWSVFEGWTVL